jgi:HK97 family phage portal protein
MLSYGQAFNEKVYASGAISEIIPLHPSRMKTEQIENGRLRYSYREAQGTSTVYTQDAIMQIRGMSDDGVNGMSMIDLARDAIGLARACEIHGATFFGNGARPGVILSTDQMLSPEAAENTRNQWERAHRGADRSNRTAVLQGGLKVNELGGNNQESQFLEARRFQTEEICRVFGVPPHLAGDLSRSSFSNIEQQSLDYLQNGLMPWLRRIESAIARDLLDGDDEYFAEFDTRGVLRADAAGRSAYYNTLWNLGVASVNEIRSWENMNPVEGGDTRFVQLNMTTLDKAAAEPETPAAVVDAILAGVPDQPVPPPATSPAPQARSLPETRAMTISIDFDRTFAADPQLWGEFARKSAAEGNTVVMISRRPEEDRQTVMNTVGDYADAFSQVVLVGGDTLKADAAEAAGINVDVWVDDSPQTITDSPAPNRKTRGRRKKKTDGEV